MLGTRDDKGETRDGVKDRSRRDWKICTRGMCKSVRTKILGERKR